MSDVPNQSRTTTTGRGSEPDSGHAKPTLTLDTAVQYVKGVGPRRADRFRHLGIETIRDLLDHLPHRYEREQAERPIGQLAADQIVTASGEIGAIRVVGRGRRARFEATLVDPTGRLHLTWFNGGYLVNKLHAGMLIRVQGKAKRYQGYLQMVNPKWSVIGVEDELDAPSERSGPKTDDRIRPVYPATEELTSETIDQAVQYVLDEALPLIDDHLPDAYRNKRELPALRESYRMIHRPAYESEVAEARRRLVFDEFLLLQLAIAIKREQLRGGSHAPALKWNHTIDERIRARFPFALTGAQNQAIEEIRADLTGDIPMNRLLQGDVGSGKTVVALYAMLMAAASKYQAALMAPTEVLAEQHFLSVSSMLSDSKVRIELLTGRMPKAEQQRIQSAIAEGDVDIVIGTHALLSKGVRFHALGVVVIDEQHRFGVEQRAALRERAVAASGARFDSKERETASVLFEGDSSRSEDSAPATPNGITPHTLVMTATPIPRTMALTVFGDLDISTINELPPGRSPVITRVVPDEKRSAVYEYVAERLRDGEQAYVVVPAIDEASATELRHVREHAHELGEGPFNGFRIGEMHGRMKRETRARIMHRFRNNEIHVLVATTVIEVGVDVPNATVMIVEHAERFGLSQLHQLRGRVGRGSKKSLCVFIADPTTDDAKRRMEAIASTTNGFEIAEKDFDIRGMGEIFGTRQSGATPFRIAEFPRDFDLLRLARRDAQAWIKRDRDLSNPEHELLRNRLMQHVGKHFGIGDVG